MANQNISTSIVDVVAILDQETLAQVFTTARPMRATVREMSKTMVHPAENGIIIGDHRIILQTEIDIPFIITALNYSQAYGQIKNLYLAGTLLSVQTRTGVYGNMLIEDLPHDETSDMFDAITIELHMKEVLYFPAPSTYQPADAQNQNTVQSGQQQPTVAAAPPQGFDAAWFNAA